MTFRELIELQHEFDMKHGWTPDKKNMESVINALNKDIVGLIGELGEFSNLVKKVNLLLDNGNVKNAGNLFGALKPALNEEIIDTLIYLMRIMSHLDIDVEEEYKNKMVKNRKKYEGYEIDK